MDEQNLGSVHSGQHSPEKEKKSNKGLKAWIWISLLIVAAFLTFLFLEGIKEFFAGDKAKTEVPCDETRVSKFDIYAYLAAPIVDPKHVRVTGGTIKTGDTMVVSMPDSTPGIIMAEDANQFYLAEHNRAKMTFVRNLGDTCESFTVSSVTREVVEKPKPVIDTISTVTPVVTPAPKKKTAPKRDTVAPKEEDAVVSDEGRGLTMDERSRLADTNNTKQVTVADRKGGIIVQFETKEVNGIERIPLPGQVATKTTITVSGPFFTPGPNQ